MRTELRSAVGSLLLAMLAMIGTAATADMVVVGPSDLQSPGESGQHYGPATGWVLATQAGQTIGDTPITGFSVGPQVPPAGLVSFKMQTGYDDTAPLEKIYLGTNNHAGLLVSDIVEFKYWTFVVSRDYTGGIAGQPPMLELTTDSGTTTQQRTFVYMPWGAGGSSGVQMSMWQEHDVMTEGRWEMLHTSSGDYYGNWTWLANRYGGGTMKLRSPYVGDYSQGYADQSNPDPSLRDFTLFNQSGTSIAIKIGSGLAGDNRYVGWWRESCAINAYVDSLIIAYRERDGQGNLTGNTVRAVYDFDDGATQPVAMTTIRATNDDLANTAAVQSSRIFVLFGRVSGDPAGYKAGEYFTIDDGSGSVRVIAPGHQYMLPGEFDEWFVRVEGRMGYAKASDNPVTYVRSISTRPDLIIQHE